MPKTKLGLNYNILGAILFLVGAIMGEWMVLIVAGYILLVEENAVLKRMAKIGIIAAVSSAGLHTFFSIFCTALLHSDAYDLYNVFYYSDLTYSIAGTLAFVGLAIYGMVATYLPPVYNAPAQPAPAHNPAMTPPTAATSRFCSQCGRQLSDNATECPVCGSLTNRSN